jgi:saccharopine dehydrogenase (NADP+, L-glutamate forming)
MKNLLVLGAGHSSPYLIDYLLEAAGPRGWTVTVADRDAELAAARVDGHPCGISRRVDAGLADDLSAAILDAEVVVNMMPPGFQRVIARECLRSRTHMLSVSYTTPEVRRLTDEARERGVLLLCELGLDPGIDHMATMSLLEKVRDEGGKVTSIESYGAGLPAADSVANPLGYAITWNPRNVVMAGADGALFLRDGEIRAVPAAQVFSESWPVNVDGLGAFEAYPNRDSLIYRNLFGLHEARTVIRGTLRYPGWCDAWLQIVKLGLNNERLEIPGLSERSFSEMVAMFLPPGGNGDAEGAALRHLGLATADPAFEKLKWLGLFSDRPIGGHPRTAVEALAQLLTEKLDLPPGGRDVVILLHNLEVAYDNGRSERICATLVEHGEPDGVSAMARTVGLPTGIAARLLLDGELALTGCHLPTEPAIYRPVLAELAREGIAFKETRE